MIKSLTFPISLIAAIFCGVEDGFVCAQSLRGIEGMNGTTLRLPSQTIVGVSIESAGDGGLKEVTTGLLKQRIEVNQTPNIKTVVDTYAGTAVKEVTLFSPSTFSDANRGTTVSNQGPASRDPNNCGALTRNNGNPATYQYPVVAGTLPAQNPLGGDFWLGQNVDNQALPDRTVSVGTGFGAAAYVCPIIP